MQALDRCLLKLMVSDSVFLNLLSACEFPGFIFSVSHDRRRILCVFLLLPLLGNPTFRSHSSGVPLSNWRLGEMSRVILSSARRTLYEGPAYHVSEALGLNLSCIYEHAREAVLFTTQFVTCCESLSHDPCFLLSITVGSYDFKSTSATTIWLWLQIPVTVELLQVLKT